MKRVCVVIFVLFVVLSSAYAGPNFNYPARFDTPQDMQDAINKGLDPNAKDFEGNPLLTVVASLNSDPEVIRVLLKAGADINARDSDGNTALLDAIFKNDEKAMFTALLEAGADVNVHGENGRTALMQVCASDLGDGKTNNEAVIALLKAGADINAKDVYGATPLILAVSVLKSPEVTTTLLSAGADAKARDSDKHTALYYAQFNQCLEGTDALTELEKASR